METFHTLWVRHGESWGNVADSSARYDPDPTLTDVGLEQAHRVAEHLSKRGDVTGSVIVSSPLRRTVATANIISSAIGSSRLLLEEGFREIDAGDLDGQSLQVTRAIREDFKQTWARGELDAMFPGGESLRDVLGRVSGAFLRSLQFADRRPVIVVGHGGTFGVCASVLFQDSEFAVENRMANGSISEARMWIQQGNLQGHMVSWNEINHLRG